MRLRIVRQTFGPLVTYIVERYEPKDYDQGDWEEVDRYPTLEEAEMQCRAGLTPIYREVVKVYPGMP